MIGRRTGIFSLHSTALGMEICAVYSGLLLLKDFADWGAARFLILFLCYPTLFLFASAVSGWGLQTRRRRVVSLLSAAFVLGAAGFVFFNFLIKGNLRFSPESLLKEIFSIGLGSLLCILGTTQTAHKTDHKHIQFRFQIAAMILLAVFLLGGKSVVAAAFFCFFASTALISSRWIDSTTGAEGMLRPLKLRVLGPVLFTMFIPALCLLLVLSPETARAVIVAISRSWIAFVRWLDLRKPPPAEGTVKEIRLFSGCSFKPSDQTPVLRTGGQAQDETGAIDDGWLISLFIIACLVIACIVVWMFIRGLKHRIRPETISSVVDAEVKSVRSGLFNRMVQLFWKAIKALCRLTRLLTNRITILFHRRRDDGPVTPRALFKMMLQWSARQGVPMSRFLTPNEHLDAMKPRFSKNYDDLAVITKLYNKDRYGRIAPNPDEFADAVTAWQRIAQGHKLK